MDRNIDSKSIPDYLDKFRAARELYAKSADAMKAYNPTTGNFDASVFARGLQKGKPLTGGLKQVGEFARAFPSSIKMPEKIGAPVSKLQAGLSAVMGAAGGFSTGGPGATAAALPFIAPPLASRFLLSKGYQKSLTQKPGQSNYSYSQELSRLAPQLTILGEDNGR